MKRWTFLGTLAGAVAALLAGGALATGSSTVKAGGCNANNFAAHMREIKGSAGAGSISYRLSLTNTGSKACRLGNYARLQLEKADGKDLPTHVHQVGTPATITVAAGATASAPLRFSPDIPGPGEPKHGPCEPRASLVVVTLLYPSSGSTVAQVRPKTSVCSHGSIQEQPLH